MIEEEYREDKVEEKWLSGAASERYDSIIEQCMEEYEALLQQKEEWKQKLYSEIQSTGNFYDFYYDFIADATTQNEMIKAIIEYPSMETVKENIQNNKNLEELKFNNPDCANLIQSLMNFEDIDYDYDPEYEQAIEEAESIIDSELSLIEYLESNVLVFKNEDDVSGSTNVQLIQNLELDCDNNGIFRLYNQDGEILSRSDGSKLRTITATYGDLVTGNPELDHAEKIIWKIPVESTMIYPPTDGYEYDTVEDKNLIRVYKEKDFCVIERGGVSAAANIGESDQKQSLNNLE